MHTPPTLDLDLEVLDLEVLDERQMKEIDGGCPLLDWIRGVLFPIDTPECTCGECGAMA
jgi:hypothetical protein